MLWARPLLALPDGTVIAGNQRLRAALELGLGDDPGDLRRPLARSEARLWALRDNNAYGEWDEPALAEILAELAADGVDLALAGFASATSTGSSPGIEPPADPDEAPRAARRAARLAAGRGLRARCRTGCCAATRPTRRARRGCSAASSAEVVWTDPPYGVDYVGKTRRELTIANDDAEAAGGVRGGARGGRPARLRRRRAFYVCAPGGPLGTGFRLALDEAGWRLHQTLVWVKNRFVLGHGDHQLQHEDILYGWTPGPGRPGRGRHKGSRWHGGNNAVERVLR